MSLRLERTDYPIRVGRSWRRPCGGSAAAPSCDWSRHRDPPDPLVSWPILSGADVQMAEHPGVLVGCFFFSFLKSCRRALPLHICPSGSWERAAEGPPTPAVICIMLNLSHNMSRKSAALNKTRIIPSAQGVAEMMLISVWRGCESRPVLDLLTASCVSKSN